MQMNKTGRKRKAQHTPWKPSKLAKSDKEVRHDKLGLKKKNKAMSTEHSGAQSSEHLPKTTEVANRSKSAVADKNSAKIVSTKKKIIHKHKGHRAATVGKHRVKTEKRSEKDQSDVKPVEIVEMPKSADDVSSNWRQLQQMLSQDSKKKSKRPAPKFKVKAPPKPTQPETTGGAEIWFDDVDDIFIDTLRTSAEGAAPDKADNPLTKNNMFTGVTKVVGMDCEMVGIGDGQESMLARVSIVNHDGHTLYDKFVLPREKVVDYRTFVSGVRAEDLVNAHPFEEVQKEIAELLEGRILVGHALHNDMKALYFSHPRKDTRDTAKFKPFRHLVGGRTPSLKKLAKELLGVEVQSGEHSSVQDAQAAMRIYTMHRKEWEKHIKDNRRGKGRPRKRTNPTSAQTES